MKDGNPQNDPSANKPLVPAALIYVLVGLGLLALVVSYFYGASRPEIPYSEFEREVLAGRVTKVVVHKNTGKIDGLYKRRPRSADRKHERKKESSSIFGARSEGEGFTTVYDDSEKLLELLHEGKVPVVKYKMDTSWTEHLFIWLMVVILLFVIFRAFTMRMGGPGSSMASFMRSRARLVNREKSDVTFEDVAGIDEAKEELKEVVEFLRTPKKFQLLGGKIPKGVLLVGAPGTGKTLLAKAVAGEADVPFFSLSGSEFVEMFVGLGAARVRDLFQQANSNAPCIVFIDELDALGKTRGFSPVSGDVEREQTLNQLLVEMDGFETNRGVIIMAASNRPETLDPALLRPGRFDRNVVVDKPDLLGREAILKVHGKNIKLDEDVDMRRVAALTPGLVGADLANLINEAALLAARKDKDAVGLEEMEEAIERLLAGLEKKRRLMSSKEKEIVAYHEAGHALAASLVEHADPVRKISTIPRGVAALGYTMQMPTEDRYLMTNSELHDRLLCLLSGRVSEEIVFSETSTGAANDLQMATEIARRMVTDFGMSRLGPIAFNGELPSRQLADILSPQKVYSEYTAKRVDAEIQRIVQQAYDRARSMLVEHRDVLGALAKALKEREVIEAEELRQILGEFGITVKEDQLTAACRGEADQAAKAEPPPVEAAPESVDAGQTPASKPDEES